MRCFGSYKLAGLFLAGALTFASGCAGGYLTPDNLHPEDSGFSVDETSRITDTPKVRQVLEVLGQYRRAVVSKDIGALNRLVSSDYYDNAGSTDTTSDDYGHKDLSEVMELMSAHTESIRYSVVVKDVVLDQANGRAHIDYEFEYAYQYRVDDESRWDAGIDVNRMQLALEGDRWRIVGGL